MRVITAPEEYKYNDNDITCFLAGGITDCEDWQSKVINTLKEFKDTDNLVIFNPRRTTFDVTDKSASEKQIKWEFDMLNLCDIFSMYFADSKSVQPICMYELGRNLLKKKMEHTSTVWDILAGRIDKYVYVENFIVIGCSSNYSRFNDVVIQSELAIGKDIVEKDISPEDYAKAIYIKYLKVKDI